MMADASWVILVLSRWFHVVGACLLVGGTFFAGMLVPGDASEGSVYLRVRRGFKMTVHVCTLLLLASGAYNAVTNWPAYGKNIPLTHALFGPHLLLGLVILTYLMVMLARKQPTPGERRGLKLSAVLLFLTVLIASGLKYAREHPKAQRTGGDVQVTRTG